MSLLKVVPIALAMVTVGAMALGAIVNSTEDTEPDGFEETKQAVLDRMKQCQNELARLSDIKLMNDKREATKMVSNVELSIDGVEITELISKLEEELSRLTKVYNSVK